MAAGPESEDFSSKIDALVGARVRMLRERRKMSQTSLGEAIGVSFQQVQKYERGANRISASALFQIAKALGVTPADFFEDLQGQSEGGMDWSRMADPQLRDMIDNFSRIPSTKVKAKIAELIEQLAGG
jgi:transcriptional regulator with XRE-family HTH domain